MGFFPVGYILKPFSKGSFLRTVREILSKQNTKDESADSYGLENQAFDIKVIGCEQKMNPRFINEWGVCFVGSVSMAPETQLVLNIPFLSSIGMGRLKVKVVAQFFQDGSLVIQTQFVGLDESKFCRLKEWLSLNRGLKKQRARVSK